jgi:hypothetical protein
MKTKRLSPEIIEQALREATDEQFNSERGRRNAAARQTLAGGRPKTLKPCPFCRTKLGARELTAHKPTCPQRPTDRHSVLLAEKKAIQQQSSAIQRKLRRDKSLKSADRDNRIYERPPADPHIHP